MTVIALENGKLHTKKNQHDLIEDREEKFVAKQVERKVQSALHETGFHELRRVDVRRADDIEDEGHVTLHGTVSRYYLKQVAQTVAHKLDGVRAVTNHIRVLNGSRAEANG